MQDERVMQLFGLVNTMLANDRTTADRDLSIARCACLLLLIIPHHYFIARQQHLRGELGEGMISTCTPLTLKDALLNLASVTAHP